MSRNRDVWIALLIGCVLAGAIFLGAKLISLTNQIQQERYSSAYVLCSTQNARHDATVKALQGVLATAEAKQPKRTAQIQASAAPTMILINALAPKQDCVSIARLIVSQK